jgi:hypothetical protein
MQAHTSIWGEGQAPLPPAVYQGTGRPPKLLRRDEQSRPVSVQQAALDLPASAWAQRDVARRRGGCTAFALCPPAGAARTSGLRAGSVARAGVAPHRMAERRGRAHQVFSLNPAAGPFSAAVGRDRETTVAHRARRSATEARTRLGPLGGPGLARLSPSRYLVPRRLRLPGGREGGFPPSGAAAPFRLKAPRRPTGFQPRGAAGTGRAT